LYLLCVCLHKAVLSAHDTVAQKNFDPVLPPLPEDVDDDLEEESVKIVRLVKNKEPLVRACSHRRIFRYKSPSFDYYCCALKRGFNSSIDFNGAALRLYNPMV